MRALVTGGAGFIGSHLCEFLLHQGWEVVCMDNFVTGSSENVAPFQARPGFGLVRHNVTEYIRVDRPLDWVLHLASPASPRDYLELPIQTLKVGALGTHTALGVAKATGARFLLASTSEVYGDPHVHPQREDYWGNVNPVGPRGVYDEAKRFAEAITMAYHRTHGVDTRIARIFNCFGPRMRGDDGRAIPAFISQALASRPLTVFGDGSQTRSFQYIADLIDGLDNLSTGRRERVNPAARLVVCDLRSARLDDAIAAARPDAVAHLAAQAAVSRSVTDPRFDASVNVFGTLGLLDAARRAAVRRVVYVSTGGAVYGDTDVLPTPEQHPTRPASPY